MGPSPGKFSSTLGSLVKAKWGNISVLFVFHNLYSVGVVGAGAGVGVGAGYNLKKIKINLAKI